MGGDAALNSAPLFYYYCCFVLFFFNFLDFVCAADGLALRFLVFSLETCA